MPYPNLSWLAPMAGLALLVPGCAAAGNGAQMAADAGIAAACAGSERFDTGKIGQENAERRQERAELIARLASLTPLPPGAENSETLIRVRVPDTAMWPWDTRLTLWKDRADTWQIATNTIRYNLPPPPPHPPPPPLDEDGNPLYHWEPPPEPVDKPPYLTSPLRADLAEALDERLAEPCFRSGPDNFSYMLPRRVPEADGNTDWICPPDSAFYAAELRLPGEPVRYLSHACYLDFAVSQFLTFAAYLAVTPADELAE